MSDASLLRRSATRLAAPVSGASLGVFRIAFGLLMAYEGLYILGFIPFAPNGAIAFRQIGQWFGLSSGEQIPLSLVQTLYTGPHVHWNIYFPGFSWVRPLPEPGTTLIFVALSLAALFVAAGWFYRPAIVALTLLFGYVNLLDLCVYLNHFYLAWLICLLLCFMPADRCFSFTSWLRRDEPSTASRFQPPEAIPFWCLFLLRAQMVAVYVFAGLAKTNPDWLAGEPVRTWLHQPNAAPYLPRYIGAAAAQSVRQLLATESATWLMVYGGLLLDLSVGFLLLSRRTRWLGVLLLVAFHGSNFFLFQIGAFPVMALMATTLFLESDWPLRPRWWLWSFLLLCGPPGILGVYLLRRAGELPATAPARSVLPSAAGTSPLPTWAMAVMGLYLAVQIIVPLRHFLIPGYVCWTEEGSLASWHMMLRHKTTGAMTLEVVDPGLTLEQGPAGAHYTVPPREGDLSPRIYRQVDATAIDWRGREELLLTYEPIIGERLLYNPLSAANKKPLNARELAEQLQPVFGRSPQVLETYPLPTIVATHRKQLEDQLRQEHATGPISAQRVRALGNIMAMEKLLTALDQVRDDPAAREETIHALQRLLQMQVQIEGSRLGFVQFLQQAAPFSLQGASVTRSPWLVVFDPRLLEAPRPQSGALFSVDRRAWRGHSATLIDLERLHDLHFRALPEVISLVDFHGRPALVWNPSRDLHPLQLVCVRTNAPVLHRYANRVADLWHDRYGRRPQVYASSWVKLNARPLQPLIDEKVDLAATPLAILRHNEWIRPLAPFGQESQTDASAPNEAPAGKDKSSGWSLWSSTLP